MLSCNVYDFYVAQKAYVVGSLRTDGNKWSEMVAYENAALGSELQGDLHLVLVSDADLRKISIHPDEYVLALKAYWQNPKYFNKDALRKNAIIVVIGTSDGKTVSWGRATTGMPLGNERMITEIRNSFEGVSFTPESVIGSIRGYFEVYGQKVKSDHEVKGRLDSVIWGLELKETRFRRVSMSANDPDDFGQGFKYLANEIQLTGFQHGMILFFALLGCSGVWWIATVHGTRDPRNHDGPFNINDIESWWKSQWRQTKIWMRDQKNNIAGKASGRKSR